MNIFSEPEEIENHNTILVVTPTEKLQDTIFESVRSLTNKGLSGIYVTFSKPCKPLEGILKEKNIDTDKLNFIDCISRSTVELKKENNVLYVTSRGDLNSLGIAITQSIKSEPNKKFLLIDAIETLLIYNKVEMITIFIQSLIKKANEFGLKLIIFTSGKDVRLLNRISLFFDKIIKVK